jgi:hypothetical protein
MPVDYVKIAASIKATTSWYHGTIIVHPFTLLILYNHHHTVNVLYTHTLYLLYTPYFLVLIVRLFIDLLLIVFICIGIFNINYCIVMYISNYA